MQPSIMSRAASFATSFRVPALRSAAARSLSTTATRHAGKPLSTDDSVDTKHFPHSDHATNKTDKLDVQSEQSTKGRQAKSQGTGGHATEQRDKRQGAKKAKEEYPEAPTTIGFQDERGGRS